MKHVMNYKRYYEGYDNDPNANDYAVGDMIKIHWNGEEHGAIITDKKSNNSFIINIIRNQKQIAHDVAITGHDIKGLIKGNSEPGVGNDWVKFKMDNISNDMVINNYPSGNPTGGDMGYK